jgi:DNA repair protein RAD5
MDAAFRPRFCRAQENDRTMAEMEPADTFTLTLRGYQKQALL